MNSLSRLAVILASLFGVMALFPILWLYASFEQSSGIQFSENRSQPSMVKTVATTTDVESLRRVCNLLAASADNDTIIRQANSRALDNIRWGGIAILLGWSAIAIMGFLYLAWKIRKQSELVRAEKNNAL